MSAFGAKRPFADAKSVAPIPAAKIVGRRKYCQRSSILRPTAHKNEMRFPCARDVPGGFGTPRKALKLLGSAWRGSAHDFEAKIWLRSSIKR